MSGFTIDSLLVIACLCQNVAFVQCSSNVETAKYSESSGQEIARCLKSCADFNIATILKVKVRITRSRGLPGARRIRKHDYLFQGNKGYFWNE